MLSIVTNAGAISAVDSLRSIGSVRDAQHSQLVTGLRVASAQDNSAYWSISKTMGSDNKAFAAVADSLSFGAATVDVAYTGMTAVMDVVEEIKKKLISAQESGIHWNKINLELKELRQEIYTIIDGSSFNGVNWLTRRSAADDKDHELVGSFVRDRAGNVSVKTLVYQMDNAKGTNHIIDEDSQVGILTNAQYATDLGTSKDWVLINGRNQTAHTEFNLSATTTDQEVNEMIYVTDAMLLGMTDAATQLGAIHSRIGMQEEFVADLQDSQDRGIGKLIDADLESASARLRAIEAQAKLATTVISIANNSPLDLLELLR